MKNAFLHPLLIDELEDMYDAEQQIAMAMPQFIVKTKNPELKRYLTKGHEETYRLIEKIEKIGKELDIDLEGTACLAMEGILDEASKHLEEMQPSLEADLMLIALAQRIKHYEIVSCGTASNYAEKMDHDNIAQMIDEITDKEGEIDKKLTSLANAIISQQSNQAQI